MHKVKFKPRNPYHDHPLMKKGGVHEKSKKSKRQIDKVKLRKEWNYLVNFIRGLLDNSIPLLLRN